MASNKNQHFVPRCLLRPFTRDEAGRAINIFNIDRELLIHDAPVRHQCARDRFYGDNDALEKAIQAAEAGFADAARALRLNPFDMPPWRKVQLARFWLLQHMRTEAASQRAVEHSIGVGKYVGRMAQSIRLEIREAVLLALQAFVGIMDMVDDLEVCLVENRSPVPFVSSDDPAVLTNRWYFHDRRTLGMSFGLQAAGAVLLLPISPDCLFFAYDREVYTVTTNRGVIVVRDEWDVRALNEHQLLNCRANLFVRDAQHGRWLAECYKQAKGRRPKSSHLFHYAVKDESQAVRPGFTVYKVVEYTGEAAKQNGIIHSQVVHPRPLYWPRFLRWHVAGSVYTRGDGNKCVRKTRTEGESGFSRIRLKRY